MCMLNRCIDFHSVSSSSFFFVVGLVEGTNSFQFVQSQVALKIRFIIFRVERMLDKKVGISSGVFIER